jgi:predicted secreted protein
MNLIAGLVTFIIIWWTALFMILPIGVKHADKPEPGMMPGAPINTDMKKVLIRTTLLSIVLWLIVFTLAELDVISFRRMALEMGPE